MILYSACGTFILVFLSWCLVVFVLEAYQMRTASAWMFEK